MGKHTDSRASVAVKRQLPRAARGSGKARKWVNASLYPDVLVRVDELAKEKGLTRSSTIGLIVMRHFGMALSV